LPRRYTIHREQWVPRPVDEVFSFFSDPRNLEILTPAWLKFRIVPPAPIEMAAGIHIQYRLSWHGIVMGWTSEITRWRPPHDFEDVQLSGPYKLWCHTHRFQERDDGTQMTDVVDYALPLGSLGRVAHMLQVRRNVETIFDYRYDRIREIFGGPEWEDAAKGRFGA
jgi:ligand-binding SRPBCC domain-containing protein